MTVQKRDEIGEEFSCKKQSWRRAFGVFPDLKRATIFL